MNNKPIIGVMPLWDGEKQSVWIHSGYIDGVIKAGGAPVLLPLTEEDEAFCRALEICDGILITGGQDVSPALYGESPKSGKADACPLRDRLEAHAVKAADFCGFLSPVCNFLKDPCHGSMITQRRGECQFRRVSRLSVLSYSFSTIEVIYPFSSMVKLPRSVISPSRALKP